MRYLKNMGKQRSNLGRNGWKAVCNTAGGLALGKRSLTYLRIPSWTRIITALLNNTKWPQLHKPVVKNIKICPLSHKVGIVTGNLSQNRQCTLIHLAYRIAQRINVLRRMWGNQYRFAFLLQIEHILTHIPNAVLVKTDNGEKCPPKPPKKRPSDNCPPPCPPYPPDRRSYDEYE